MQTEESVQEALKQWLLGLLPQQEGQSLEERLITDTALYEELHIVEDELIDQYLGNALTATEREAFESYFMNSTERQEQFRIANALRVYIDDSKPDVAEWPAAKTTPNRFWTPFRNTIANVSLAAAALLVVVFASWALLLRSPSAGKSMSVILTPGVQTRGDGSIQTVALTSDVKYLQLHLKLAQNDFPQYRVILLNSDSDVIQTEEDLKPVSGANGPTIQLTVNAAQVPPGEYRLKLDGVSNGKFESADSYRFLVVAQ